MIRHSTLATRSDSNVQMILQKEGLDEKSYQKLMNEAPSAKKEQPLIGESISLPNLHQSSRVRDIKEAVLKEGLVVIHEHVLLTLTNNRVLHISKAIGQGDSWQTVIKIEESSILSVESSSVNHSFFLHFFPFVDDKKRTRQHKALHIFCVSDTEKQKWMSTITNDLLGLNQNQKRAKLRVLVNPFGGKKMGPKVWASVAHIFKLANIEVDVSETRHIGHAAEIAAEIDISAYTGIVAVSGDGIPHEIFNGLMSRADAHAAIRFPVGHIPAGSGNGLSAALGAFDPVTAVFNIIKGRVQPIDLMSVSQGSKKKYCFLSISWGIIGDIDLESEKYRWMGPARVTFAGVLKIFTAKLYSAKLSFIKSDQVFDDGTNIEDLPESAWTSTDGEFRGIVACNVTHIALDCIMAPKAKLADGCVDIVALRDSNRVDLAQFLLGLESGDHVKLSCIEYSKVRAFKLTPTSDGVFSFDGEHGEYTPIFCKMIPSVARVLG